MGYWFTDLPSTIEPSCADDFNVGVLDGVGVVLAWITVFRWFLVVTFKDDINILLCLPNPTINLTLTDLVIYGITSIIGLISHGYTVVKAFRCGDPMIGSILVLVSIYEIYFKIFKRFFIFVFDDNVDGPLWLTIMACAFSLTYDGDMRLVGLVGLGIATLTHLYHVFYYNIFRKNYREVPGDWIYIGPNMLTQGLLFPAILACFITVTVRDQTRWTPHPQSKLEMFLLVVRVFFGSGISEIFSAFFMTIYRAIANPRQNLDNQQPFEEFWQHVKSINVTWMGVKNPAYAQQLRVQYAFENNSDNEDIVYFNSNLNY